MEKRSTGMVEGAEMRELRVQPSGQKRLVWRYRRVHQRRGLNLLRGQEDRLYTYLAQLIDLVKKAQESRSRTQDLANRKARYLAVVALSVGAITPVAWLFEGRISSFAVERAVTVMVVTCPHSLALAATDSRSPSLVLPIRGRSDLLH